MKRYDGLWLFSDVDGTLLTDSYLLPDRSRAALETFVSEGGKLSLATGRGASPTTRELVKSLPINAPCVLNNGAVLYELDI